MVEVPAFSMLYLVVTYVIHYGVSDLKLPYTNVLLVTVGSGVVTFFGILISSRLSDRFGRRPVLIVSSPVA